MNVLALYDIHGNVDALVAVLDDRRVEDAEAIVVGGDVVPGAFAAECLAMLEGLAVPVHWLRGNGEREVAQAARLQIVPETVASDALVELTAAASAARLDREQAERLGNLPTAIELDGVLYCHATPRRDDEILTRISPYSRWAEVLAGVTHHLVVAGHTHQQDDRVVEGIRFVNAGSVGLPYEGDPAARWAWIANGKPELHETSYDGAAAGRRMLAAGWPDEQSIKGALLEPVDPAVVTEQFESFI